MITSKSPFSFFLQMANHSQLKTATSIFDWISTSECNAWLAVFGTEAVAIVTFNALTIMVYMKERSLRKRSMYLVVNLAVADMFVGTRVIMNCWILGNICDFWRNNLSNKFYVFILDLFSVFPIASLTNLGAISLERTHATFRPFHHRLVKRKIFGAAIAIVWITAGLISSSLVLRGASKVLTFQPLSIFNISYFSFFSLCLLIIVVSYSLMALKIVCGTQPHHHGAASRERKLTKTLFIVTVVSLLLTLPFIIFRIREIATLRTSKIIWLRTIFRLHYSFLFLFYTNSLVNPVLYTFRMPEFRRALFSVLHCRYQPQLSARVFPLNDM